MASTNILNDDTILGIIKNVNLYSEFPALQAINKTIYEAPQKQGGCSKCMRNKIAAAKSTATKAIQSFKEYIRRLDQDTRNKFKQAINCGEIRFTMLDTDGRYKEFRY